MVKLNLLPAKVRAAEMLRMLALAGAAVYLLALLVLGWRLAVARQALAAVNVKIAKVESDLKPLQAIADEVKKLTDEKSEQDVKKARLSELSKRQAYLVRVLDALPDFMQGGQVWIAVMDTVPGLPGQLRRVSLDCKAPSIEVWADFYGNLESQSLVSDLKIDSPPVVTKEGQRQSYRFKVSFVLKEPQ